MRFSSISFMFFCRSVNGFVFILRINQKSSVVECSVSVVFEEILHSDKWL